MTDEAREIVTAIIRDVLDGRPRRGDPLVFKDVAWCEAIDAALARTRAAALEEAARVADRWHAAYPVDVFTEPTRGEHGSTVDACSARAARHVSTHIAEEIHALASARGTTAREGTSD